MAEAAVEFDPSTLAAFAEELDPNDVAETEDFSPTVLIPVGNYMNPSRTLGKVSKKFNPKHQKEITTVELVFSGGLHAEDGTVYGVGGFPERYWINSFTTPGRPGTSGETSSLATYMKECGFETAGKSVRDLILALPETLNTPLNAFVKWTDKGKKTGEVKDGKPVYTNANLKLRDFKTGMNVDGSPIYSRTIVKDGITYEAVHKINSVKAIK